VLAKIVEELGSSIKARTVEETAKPDIVLVALRWVDLPKALGGLPAWSGRIVIGATNPVAFLDANCRMRKIRAIRLRRTASRRSIWEAGTPAQCSATSSRELLS
jgi:predicted dinucleotide-binding enzyme